MDGGGEAGGKAEVSRAGNPGLPPRWTNFSPPTPEISLLIKRPILHFAPFPPSKR